MKVLMTGSSGLVGTALTEALAREGHTVVRLVRSGSGKKRSGKPANKEAEAETKPTHARGQAANTIDVAWNPNTCDLEGEPFGTEQEKVEGADAVVNLAGASIGGESWSAERKALLRSSRVQFTRELLCALEKLSAPPRTLVSASAIGYYGNRGDEVLTEESSLGTGFLPEVCREGEAAAHVGNAG